MSIVNTAQDNKNGKEQRVAVCERRGVSEQAEPEESGKNNVKFLMNKYGMSIIRHL